MRMNRLLAAVVGVMVGAGACLAQTYSNTAPITIPLSGPATPYPSVINVVGATTNIEYVTVTINGLSHTYPQDLQVLLVAPGGQRVMLFSGVGSDIDISNVSITLAPDAANVPPTATQLLPGTYRPANFLVANLPAPAPAGPYSTNLGVFNGLNANGAWTLYVNDRFTGDGGTIAGGWTIRFNDPERQPNPAGTAFTYQGRLDGVPPDASVGLRFRVWNHPTSINSATNAVSVTLTRDVTLANGTFTTPLDFGPVIQQQDALFLEVQVSPTGIAGPWTTLTPRQPLTGAPFALQTRGVTVDSANRVGVGGIARNDLGFVFEASQRIRVRGTAGFSVGSPGVWFASPDPSGTLVNRGFVGMVDDSNVGFFNNGNWGLLLNSNGNTSLGAASLSPPPERLTVNGSVQIDTAPSNRLGFGPVGDFGNAAENSDAVFFQRVNTSSPTINTSTLRLALGDDGATPASADAFSIGFVTGGTGAFTERFRFSTDGNAFKPGGGSWSVLSDQTAKTDLSPLRGTLDRLLSLHGYSFSYKPEFVADGRGLPGTQVGLLAQEVQQVFPDWVGTGPDGKLFVTERSTTALMVEAMRDLREEKDKQIDELREQNQQLQRRLEALERLLTQPAGSSK